MNKRLILTLTALTSINILNAGSKFGEGFGVGAVTGLIGGVITSKIAESRPRPIYHQTVVVEDPYVYEKREELRIRENNIRQAERQAELERRRITREKEMKRAQELARIAQEEDENDDYIIENTVVETKTVKNPNSKSSSKNEKEIELQIIREKKELLKEENRKKELDIKAKELELKLIKAKKDEAESSDDEMDNHKTVIKTVSKKTIKPRYVIG